MALTSVLPPPCCDYPGSPLINSWFSNRRYWRSRHEGPHTAKGWHFSPSSSTEGFEQWQKFILTLATGPWHCSLVSPLAGLLIGKPFTGNSPDWQVLICQRTFRHIGCNGTNWSELKTWLLVNLMRDFSCDRWYALKPTLDYNTNLQIQPNTVLIISLELRTCHSHFRVLQLNK